MEDERRVSQTENTYAGDFAPTRRHFLRRAGLVALGAALSPAILETLAGCSSGTADNDIKMGIVFGNQILWRYLAQKKDSLLKPLGYNVTFSNYQVEDELTAGFLNGKIDVCATVFTALPALSASAEAQLFLPIAWMKWGYPIVVPESSSLRSVADLPGKKLAIFDPSHPSTAYWQAFVLENYGFNLREKVEMVEYSQLQGGNPADVVRDAKADAAVADSYALSTLLPPGSYRQIGDLRSEWRKIARSDRLLAYGGYVAKVKWVEANKKFVEDLIRLNYEALAAYRVNRAAMIDPATAYAGENAPPMTKESSSYVAEYLGYDDVQPERVYLSTADVDDYKAIFSLFAKAAYLKSAPQDVSKLFYLSDKRPKER